MSILASLVRSYDRLPGAPPFGFSSEKISFLISLNERGAVVGLPHDLRGEDKKRTPRLMAVPASFKRPGVTPRSFFLWDNTAYALGISKEDGKDPGPRHQAFRDYHLTAIRGLNDAGLTALVAFLTAWTPERFTELRWPEEMKDQNVIFGLESERLAKVYLHDRPAAKTLWARLSAAGDKTEAVCLVTGEQAPVARLHPAIKGVWGAQSSGASMVSFNLDAFTSYGHDQGDNAPVSEAAAFAYTTALNRFLERDSGHRIQIGDASTVFWADATEADKARQAENLFAEWFEGSPPDTRIDEKAQAKLVGTRLAQIKAGEALSNIPPSLAEGVRFHVLGLAPNAARLSIRFYYENDFGTLAENYRRYVEDMRLEPPPRDGSPPLWRYLVETAVLGKRENIPPNLAGEWLRAILSGTPYPLTLLSNVLMRLRADQNVNALRVAMLKAIIVRNFSREDTPVALQPDYPSKGYQLGRLFAVYERIQTEALGDKVNSSVRDKYYGSASAQPRKVFPALDRGSSNHLSKLAKINSKRSGYLLSVVESVMETMSPSDDPYPTFLSAEDQALFGLGYHHQHHEFYKPRKTDTSIASEEPAK